MGKPAAGDAAAEAAGTVSPAFAVAAVRAAPSPAVTGINAVAVGLLDELWRCPVAAFVAAAATAAAAAALSKGLSRATFTWKQGGPTHRHAALTDIYRRVHGRRRGLLLVLVTHAASMACPCRMGAFLGGLRFSTCNRQPLCRVKPLLARL